MQYLIHVTYIPATDTRGSGFRVRSATGKTVTVPYDYGARDAHRSAIDEWAAKNSLSAFNVEELVSAAFDGRKRYYTASLMFLPQK
jgi:hypothetical protein